MVLQQKQNIVNVVFEWPLNQIFTGNVTYVIGGVGERSVEYIDMKGFDLVLDDPNAIESHDAFIPKSRQKFPASSDKKKQLTQLPNWQLGPSLPDVRARACAAASDANKIYLVGKSISPNLLKQRYGTFRVQYLR